MPLVLDLQLSPRCRLMLWSISEQQEQLCALVAPSDRISAERFSNPRRRLEHLAWRAALRSAGIDAAVEYDAAGAPFLSRKAPSASGHKGGKCAGMHGDRLFISVSHTAEMAAVMIANVPCALDIEPLSRNLSSVRERFLSADEMLFGADIPLWCAKEAMYKYSGRRGLDFREDLRVVSADLDLDFAADSTADSAADSAATIATNIAANITADYRAGTIVGNIDGRDVRIGLFRHQGYLIACIPV